MKLKIKLLMMTIAAVGQQAGAQLQPIAHWRMDEVVNGTIVSANGNHAASVEGQLETAPGAVGGALVFDGRNDSLTVADSTALSFPTATFGVAAWVNAYAPGNGEQMLIGKNNYGANQREWSLLISKDRTFRLYLRDGSRWTYIASKSKAPVGQWTHVGVSVERGMARIYVGGKLEAEQQLAAAVGATPAPVVIGGSGRVKGKLTQPFNGALDEMMVFNKPLTAGAIAAMADISPPAAHTPSGLPFTGLPNIAGSEAVGLWSLPDTIDLEPVEGVRFSSIKDYEPEVDGFHWLHGVGLMWHKGKLYASFGHNKGHENSAGEMARYRVSDDGGETWGAVKTIAASEGNHSVSHGVFCSTGGTLWAFQGAFYDRFQRTHCMGYRLNEQTDEWEPLGTMVDHGFWPMQQPEKMANGNWIMAGVRVRNGYNPEGMEGGNLNLPAVAISHGNDLTKWDMVVVPLLDGLLPPWGESSVIIDGSKITLISRWMPKNPYALVAESPDSGRTWTDLHPSTMPMAPSKPCAGMLSTGQRYLISNSSGNNGNARVPLTIAYSLPGKTALTKIRVILHGSNPGALKPANRFSYPCAIEHDGMLYVGYSDAGGRRGNNNDAELAVFPIRVLH